MNTANKSYLNVSNACLLFIIMFLAGCDLDNQGKTKSKSESKTTELTTTFTYQEITGIGKDSLYNRRDNSDIIRVGDTYYIWYSRMDSPITAGYWATIWYATSEDEGYTWQEQGRALGLGEKGTFDSHSVFTPNILTYEGKYYLYYTGVRPTPGNADNVFENNSTNDFTAIGLAVSDHPDGPFVKVEINPVLEISPVAEDFDSYRIDDASLLVKDEKIYLYYKGRSIVHGKKGPGLTEMSAAFADHPAGPFVKHEGSILDKSHEVLIWKKGNGVASLASISKTINYAKDGLHFSVLIDSLTNIPKAPGLYRPDLDGKRLELETPGWGISMKSRKGEAYLVRFEIK